LFDLYEVVSGDIFFQTTSVTHHNEPKFSAD